MGDSYTSLRCLIVSCVLNVLLDLFFVFQCGMSVLGVAWATAASQFVAWILSTYHIRRHYLGRCSSRATWQCLSEICKIGLPVGVQHLIFAGGTIVMQVVVNGFGTAFIAGFNAASKIDMFVFMPIQSFSSAATTFVGQNLGARKICRIRKGVMSTLKVSFVVDAVFIVSILCLGPRILRTFSTEGEVIRIGLAYLYRILPFYLVYTITSMAQSVFRGVGNVIIPTVIMIAALWLGRIPSAWLLSHFLGQDNLFFCYGIGWTIELLFLTLYYRFGHWWQR